MEQYAFDAYAEFKQAIGSKAPFGIADLILEGDFVGGFVLKVSGLEIRITSEDEKTGDLAAKYGQDIFGLMEDSYNVIRPALLQSWIRQFKNDVQ